MQNIVRECLMFYPYDGYRWVTPLDAANFFYNKLKNVSCEYNREWLQLNFASCVVHQTDAFV